MPIDIFNYKAIILSQEDKPTYKPEPTKRVGNPNRSEIYNSHDTKDIKVIFGDPNLVTIPL